MLTKQPQSQNMYPARPKYPSLGPNPPTAAPPPALNERSAEAISNGMKERAYHKATTPEERAERFARLVVPRTKRAIRSVRLIGDLVTGYAVFNEAQARKICEALYNEIQVLEGKLESHLTKGGTAKEVEFDLS